MLPPDNLGPGQVRDVGNTGFAARLDDHPADVGVPEALVGVVGIEVGVGVAVVCAVTSRPPFDGTLDGTGAGGGKEVLEGFGSVVGAVSPETVVAGSDA